MNKYHPITETKALDQKRAAEIAAAAAFLARTPIPQPPPDARLRVVRRLAGRAR